MDFKNRYGGSRRSLGAKGSGRGEVGSYGYMAEIGVMA